MLVCIYGVYTARIFYGDEQTEIVILNSLTRFVKMLRWEIVLEVVDRQ